jgi:hypothetical protein
MLSRSFLIFFYSLKREVLLCYEKEGHRISNRINNDGLILPSHTKTNVIHFSCLDYHSNIHSIEWTHVCVVYICIKFGFIQFNS